MAEFRHYVINLFKDMQNEYTALANTYKEAVGKDMYEKEAVAMLEGAVAGGRLSTRKNDFSIPKGVTDNLQAAFMNRPFETMENLKVMCKHIAKHGDEGLRFTDAHKATLRDILAKSEAVGEQKADKVLADIVEKFENAFFSEWLLHPDDAAREFSRPDLVVDYFNAHPEAVSVFRPGFNLDGDNALEELKSAVKDQMTADIQKLLNEKDPTKLQSLASGIMPQSVREYNSGYVTVNGEKIPPAKLGLNFQFGLADTPDRKGYAEFLETTFDADHKKMRQMVSYSCGMALGLGGAIAAQFMDGGEKSHINGASLKQLGENLGMTVNHGDLSPEANYDIVIADNGDVTIKATCFQWNKVAGLTTDERTYNLSDLTSNKSPVFGGLKITATMKITNASDAALGENMPDFEIINISQEEV